MPHKFQVHHLPIEIGLFFTSNILSPYFSATLPISSFNLLKFSFLSSVNFLYPAVPISSNVIRTSMDGVIEARPTEYNTADSDSVHAP